MGKLQRWWAFIQLKKEHSDLYRLGDRELHDIGINRGDIDRIIWEEVEKRGNK